MYPISSWWPECPHYICSNTFHIPITQYVKNKIFWISISTFFPFILHLWHGVIRHSQMGIASHEAFWRDLSLFYKHPWNFPCLPFSKEHSPSLPSVVYFILLTRIPRSGKTFPRPNLIYPCSWTTSSQKLLSSDLLRLNVEKGLHEYDVDEVTYNRGAEWMVVLQTERRWIVAFPDLFSLV